MNPLIHLFFQRNRYLVNQLNEVLKPHGLFSSQWAILFLLHENGPMSLTSIWKYLNVEYRLLREQSTFRNTRLG